MLLNRNYPLRQPGRFECVLIRTHFLPPGVWYEDFLKEEQHYLRIHHFSYKREIIYLPTKMNFKLP